MESSMGDMSVYPTEGQTEPWKEDGSDVVSEGRKVPSMEGRSG